MRSVGRIGEVRVSVGQRDGQVVIAIWFRAGTLGGMALANLLAGGGGVVTLRPEGQWMQADVVYDAGVDGRLVELVDLLTAVRYAHPTMVQLPLALEEENGFHVRERGVQRVLPRMGR